MPPLGAPRLSQPPHWVPSPAMCHIALSPPRTKQSIRFVPQLTQFGASRMPPLGGAPRLSQLPHWVPSQPMFHTCVSGPRAKQSRRFGPQLTQFGVSIICPGMKSQPLYLRLFVKSCGWILTQNEGDASERWQHAGEDFEPKVLFIEQPVCSLLDDADLVVEPLDEAQRDFVLRFAVGGDAIPMTINHVGELFVGLQSLPLERCAPVFEEAPRPALVLVAPELAKGLLEQIGGVEALVASQQSPQSLPPLHRHVLLPLHPALFLPLIQP